jgi:hypothetical protein
VEWWKVSKWSNTNWASKMFVSFVFVCWLVCWFVGLFEITSLKVNISQTKQPMDWFSVSREELVSCGLRQTFRKKELGKVLEQLYPHIDWTTLSQRKGRFSQQRHFERVVSSLFEVSFILFPQTQPQPQPQPHFTNLTTW